MRSGQPAAPPCTAHVGYVQHIDMGLLADVAGRNEARIYVEASRALSPAVNDPGTAIHVIGVGLRVLLSWATRTALRTKDKIPYPAIHVPGLEVSDLLEDFFSPMERDGASMREVGLSPQTAFSALAQTEDSDLKIAASARAEIAPAYGQRGLALEHDIVALEAAAKR